MLNSLYYIPEISEFHVGFKYEVVIDEFVESCEFSVHDDILYISNLLDEGSIRVKVLDAEDARSLGFIETVRLSEDIRLLAPGYELIIRYGSQFAYIHLRANDLPDASPQYAGECRNINELSQIVRRLGVKYHPTYASH